MNSNRRIRLANAAERRIFSQSAPQVRLNSPEKYYNVLKNFYETPNRETVLQATLKRLKSESVRRETQARKNANNARKAKIAAIEAARKAKRNAELAAKKLKEETNKQNALKRNLENWKFYGKLMENWYNKGGLNKKKNLNMQKAIQAAKFAQALGMKVHIPKIKKN
jgi:hypothetical protein